MLQHAPGIVRGLVWHCSAPQPAFAPPEASVRPPNPCSTCTALSALESASAHRSAVVCGKEEGVSLGSTLEAQASEARTELQPHPVVNLVVGQRDVVLKHVVPGSARERCAGEKAESLLSAQRRLCGSAVPLLDANLLRPSACAEQGEQLARRAERGRAGVCRDQLLQVSDGVVLAARESEQANSAEARGDALALDTNLLALKEASAGGHRRESERAHEAVVEHHLNLETASAHHAARQDGGRRTIGQTRKR